MGETSEDQSSAISLDPLARLTDRLDEQKEQRGWSALTEAALQRVWDNDEDAVYDDWRRLYGIPGP